MGALKAFVLEPGGHLRQASQRQAAGCCAVTPTKRARVRAAAHARTLLPQDSVSITRCPRVWANKFVRSRAYIKPPEVWHYWLGV